MMRGTILGKIAPVLVAAAVFSVSACDDDGSGPEPVPSAISLASGDGQTGIVGAELDQPVVVVVIDTDGDPVSGVSVQWQAGGDGSAAPASSSTNADGRAQTSWTLGTTAGEQELQASVQGVSNLSVTADALPGPAGAIEVSGGDEQEGETGSPLPDSLAVTVTDQFGNAVEGEEVLWWTDSGDGSVQPSISETDEDGIARAEWTLGPEPGEQTANAGVTGVDPVSFTAQATPAIAVIELVSGGGQTATVATTLPQPVVVLVTDDEDEPVAGVTVTFASGDAGADLDPETVVTDGDGQAETLWTLGTVAGDQTLTATAGTLAPLEVTADALPGDPTQIHAEAGDGQQGEAEEPLPELLVALVTDEHGNPIEGVEVTWEVTAGTGSVAPPTDDTDGDGLARTEWTLGPETGWQTVEASIEEDQVEFTASSSAPPELESIDPPTLIAGETGTLTGTNFSDELAGNVVTVDGVEVDVTSASTTVLQISLPSRSAFDCRVTGPAVVSVEVDGLSDEMAHPLQVARQIELDPGESVQILDLDDVECNEIPETGGTYVMSAFNTATAPGVTIAFELHGGHLGGENPVVADATGLAAARTPIRGTDSTVPGIDDFTSGHLRVMEMNRRLHEELGPVQAGATPTSPIASLGSGLPSVGDTLAFKIPDIDASSSCTTYIEVEARAVYVGTHGIVFEDVDAPLAGDVDDVLELIGEEYDDIQHDIIVDNFGDPLAYDAAHMSEVGRVVMLFSEVVNDFGGPGSGVNGFVFSGDFRTPAQCASSDEVEIFYARVPTEAGTGFDPAQPNGWRWGMRSTVIHEVKHISSFAQRIANSRPFEESWLEEATARASEELFAREIFGYDRGERTGYAESLYCEIRPSTPACNTPPFVMFTHFQGLRSYYAELEDLTPIGNFTLDPGATFYNSGWLLTRWAADHFAASDAEFYGGLNQSSLSGIENLEAQTGLDFAEILADWTLTLAVDDRPGFTPARPELDILTWNTRDVLDGMTELQSISDPFPLAVRELSYGSFTEEVDSVRGGTAALFEISGTQAGPQLLHLRAQGGGLPPEELRAAIVRVD